MTLLKSFRLNGCDLCNFDLKSCHFDYIKAMPPPPPPHENDCVNLLCSGFMWMPPTPISILKWIVDAGEWQLLMSSDEYAETCAM